MHAENEMIEEKLSQGINGLEWLILQNNTDIKKLESLKRFMEFCLKIENKKIISIVKDAVILHHEPFYEKNEINWWIAVRESLTYLALLKEQNYNEYLKFLKSIYEL